MGWTCSCSTSKWASWSLVSLIQLDLKPIFARQKSYPPLLVLIYSLVMSRCLSPSSHRQEASIMWCDLFWPKFGQKMPKIISLHDVLEPLKQALSASRDVIISSQICGSNLQKVFTLGDGCWLPVLTCLFFFEGGAGFPWFLPKNKERKDREGLLDGRNRAIVIAESLARVIAAIRIASVRFRSYQESAKGTGGKGARVINCHNFFFTPDRE